MKLEEIGTVLPFNFWPYAAASISFCLDRVTAPSAVENARDDVACA